MVHSICVPHGRCRERVFFKVLSSFHQRPRRRNSGRVSPAGQPRTENQSTSTVSSAPVPSLPATAEQLEQIAASPFSALGLSSAIVRAVVDESYGTPTPVQAQVIPHVIAKRDVLACAQTGTGKTAAFVLPILELLSRTERTPGPIRTLVLTPTRELAAQIAERISVYGHHVGARYTVIYGGVNQRRQETALRARPELLVATPGRLLDLMQQGFVRLDGVTHLVLDEADRMLDMGFIHDVRRICSQLPKVRQTLLFSATMPKDIEQLAQSLLVDPVRVAVTPVSSTAPSIEEAVVFVHKGQKTALLAHLLKDDAIARAIVFTRTKRGANKVSEQLDRVGIGSAAIHGNKSQSARERALDGFRSGRTRVLVATDIAARGIDVDGISHVFNFDLPNEPESYVHRIGRTGRAGNSGQAISFCDGEERPLLTDIERLIRRRINVLGEETTGFKSEPPPPRSPLEARPPAGREQARPSEQRRNGRRRFGPSAGRRHS
jgi:ATP-dependent RNA helicase RhlE